MTIKQLVFKSAYEEVELLEPFLNDLQKEFGFDNEVYAKFMLTLSEAVTNAIVHGNKLDTNKKAVLKAEIDSNSFRFSISDEGDGFDPDAIKNPLAEENLLQVGGRGVFLMKTYADELLIRNGGRKITMIFNRE